MANQVTEPVEDIQGLKKQILALQKQSVAVLGDGEVFVRKTEGGKIQAVKGVVFLEERNSELAEISGKVMVTAKGFNNLNQIAGLSIITPKTLRLPEGKEVVNPYPIIDPESGSISKIWVKKMAFGYGPTSNLVITSATLLYDVRMYFVQDVLKKVKENKAAGRVCMESTLTEEDKKNGTFLKIDNTMGVWADFSNSDILKALDTFVNKKLFAERNAQSICERMVMAKHPALSHAVYVEPVGPQKARTAKVPVIGYICELSQSEMLNISEQAERGEELHVGGQKVETVEMVATATTEEMATEADTEEQAHTESPADEKGSAVPKAPSLFENGGEPL